MKHFFLTAFFLFSLASAQAQTFPSPFAYKLIDSTQASKEELYTRARAWMAKAFRSAQDVIQMDDKEAGKIIGKGNIPYPIKGGFGNLLCKSPVDFTVTIDVKDNKYRIILSDFVHKGCFTGEHTSPSGGSLDREKPLEGGFMGMTKGQWVRLKAYVDAEARATVADFNEAMKASGAAADSDGF